MILLPLGHILFLLTVPTNILISNVLNSLQNLIMQHADIRTYLRITLRQGSFLYRSVIDVAVFSSFCIIGIWYTSSSRRNGI